MKQKSNSSLSLQDPISLEILYSNSEVANLLAHEFQNNCHLGDKTPPLSDTRITEGLNHIEFKPSVIMEILKKLNPNKSPGIDGIHPRALKECAEVLCAPLANLFKCSFLEGRLPSERVAVVPIYKGGNKLLASNYRPISLISSVAKVMERVINDSLRDHLLQKSILNDCQHGFLPGRSCNTNLLIAWNSWTLSVEKKKPIHIGLLDFSKAFDRVNHDKKEETPAHGCTRKIINL
ncbi:unnamed protein product, partial [Heterobilharzia americana]